MRILGGRSHLAGIGLAALLWGGILPLALAAEETPQQPAPAEAQPEVKGVTLGYVKDAPGDKRSLGASGHATLFERPDNASFVEKVQIYAARYGATKPPEGNYHLYILNDKKQVLAELKYPYAGIERITMGWRDLRTPPVEVTKQFYVALAFNPDQAKGVFLGLDRSVEESHSFTGLPDVGFEKVPTRYDWGIRVLLTEQPSTKEGVRRLADLKKADEKADAFAGCTEIKLDVRESEGKQSYGGSGPAIQFTLAELLPPGTPAKGLSIKGFRLFASRYGGGFDPDQTFVKAALQDSQGNGVWQEQFPYALFGVKEKWVDLVAPKPIPVEELAPLPMTISFDPEAHQTKGIFFHYNKNPEVTHSMQGTLDAGFQGTPDREWMVRIYLTKPEMEPTTEKPTEDKATTE